MRLIVSILVIVLLVGFFVTANERSAPQRSAAPEGGQKVTAAAVAPYSQRLSDAKDVLAGFRPLDFTESVSSIGIALALLDSWAALLDEGSGMTMSGDTKKVRAEFVDLLRRTQSSALPVLRDKYGPAARKFLWESDVSAKTTGMGFRTIDFVGAAFAANRNIKTTQETSRHS